MAVCASSSRGRTICAIEGRQSRPDGDFSRQFPKWSDQARFIPNGNAPLETCDCNHSTLLNAGGTLPVTLPRYSEGSRNVELLEIGILTSSWEDM
jgi:hypothetical protein